MSTIKKILNTTRKTNTIVAKAGGVMIKSSFNTAKQIFTLYKDAGVKAVKFGSGVVKKTVELTVENQKELLKTSGQAIKDVAQSMRSAEVVEEKAKKAPKKRTTRRKKVQKEVSIDDLLD